MTHSEPPDDDDLVLEPLPPAATALAWDPWQAPDLCLGTLGAEGGARLAAFAADTLHDMMGHGSDRTDREVGGILVGDCVNTPRGDMTRVSDIVIADSEEASLTHVTFTHEAWGRIHSAVDQRDDGARIVGWYHTHPGFGPFLSAHDRFIHENFFSDSAHIALVLDPVQRLVAVFAWCAAGIERLPGCLLYDTAGRTSEITVLLSTLRYAGDPAPRSGGLLSWLRRQPPS